MQFQNSGYVFRGCVMHRSPCGRGSVCGLVLSRDRQGAVWPEYVSVFLK
jgi:hypothetical protein